jgi:hypothetical protein
MSLSGIKNTKVRVGGLLVDESQNTDKSFYISQKNAPTDASCNSYLGVVNSRTLAIDPSGILVFQNPVYFSSGGLTQFQTITYDTTISTTPALPYTSTVFNAPVSITINTPLLGIGSIGTYFIQIDNLTVSDITTAGDPLTLQAIITANPYNTQQSLSQAQYTLDTSLTINFNGILNLSTPSTHLTNFGLTIFVTDPALVGTSWTLTSAKITVLKLA